MAAPAPPNYITGEEIGVHWDVTYIVHSVALAALGAFCAFTTTACMRRSTSALGYWYLLIQSGLALGVCTVWGMHFVGMQALVLQGGIQSGASDRVPVRFEPVFTIVSALAAWLIATLALRVALCRDNNIFEEHQQRSRKVSIIKTILRHTPFLRIAGSSVLVAVGVCVMHYMGMLSQSGEFEMEYNGAVIFASAVVALVVSLAGLSIFFLLPDRFYFRILASLVVSVAVNSMHYTGMMSARYYSHPQTGIWGSGTTAWHMPAEFVFVGVGALDCAMMAFNGAFLEIISPQPALPDEPSSLDSEERGQQPKETWRFWGGFAVTLVLLCRLTVFLIHESASRQA